MGFMISFLMAKIFGLSESGIYFSIVELLPLSLSIYIASLGLAHIGEYLFVAHFYTEKLSWDSFLINQSKAYVIAQAVAIAEFSLEFLIFGR